MAEKYRLAIVGAGPAGLSAAGRAAHQDREAKREAPSYLLLEAYDKHAKTIQRYQKKKHVMAEPGFLDLRSDFVFGAGTREEVLQSWLDNLGAQAVNIRYGAEVVAIKGGKGDFQIKLGNGQAIGAEYVVLAIGLEGNPRKLGAPGDDLPRVQYHLDDAGEFENERILVVGAGDSAIENALALAEQNDVWIVNRRDEFSRAKEGNLKKVLTAIGDPSSRLKCYYGSAITRVVANDGGERALTVVLETPQGEQTQVCDRVIARLGSTPPRKFLESTGVKLPSERADAIPALSRTYESNVPGVYIIGSLAGYPLIKQAMNQGYDVVSYINGEDIKPADYPLLEYQFAGLPFEREADEVLDLFQQRIPMFRQLNALTFRELIIESTVTVSCPAGPLLEETQRKLSELERSLQGKRTRPKMTRVVREGDYIYRQGDFGASFFTIAEGEVILEGGDSAAEKTRLTRGQFFGESSLISGRPRLEDARAGANCILVETPRRIMVKLFNSNEEVRSGIDWIFIVRQLQRSFVPGASFAQLREIADRCKVRRYKAGEVVFTRGERGDSLHIVRSGSVTLTREVDGRDNVVAQVRSGEIIGEMSLMGDPIRRETARAAVALETVEIGRAEFAELVSNPNARIDRLQRQVSRHVTDRTLMEVRPEGGALIDFLMANGLGEATDVLVIDEDLCIGCDNCEKACADTHGGVSRLRRAAGTTYAHVHIPIACRHCEQPHCMKDCPPDAIHRAPDGQVFIADTCIGCGNCQANCPYGVIRMEYEPPAKPSLWSWLLFGAGPGPGEAVDAPVTAKAKAKGKRAMKCDACINEKSGPACVNSCPTGAAIRIGPERFIELIEKP
jgi:thioredoxin reductase/Fe-S-cluster-containing hydrogenase component 2/CRP-like cAMP-binding protein